MARESNKSRSINTRGEAGEASLKLATGPEKESFGSSPIGKGVRSPLFGQGGEKNRASVTTPPVPKVPPQPPGNAPDPRVALPSPAPANGEERPHSGIRGLNDPLILTRDPKSFVPIQHYMSDESGQQKLRFFMLIFLLATASFAFAMWKAPEFRRKVWEEIQGLYPISGPSPGKIRPKSVAKSEAEKDSWDETSPKLFEQKFVHEGKAKRVSNRTCYGFITSYVSGTKLSLPDRVDTAECYLQRGDAQGAAKVLSPLIEEIEKTSETALNRMISDRTLADAYHLLVMARSQSNRFQEATELTRNRCLKWQISNTCVTKLTLYAVRNLTIPQSINHFFSGKNDLSRKTKSRLWLAGALYGQRQEPSSTILKRFELALKATSQTDLFLKREIYESQSIYLYKIGSLNKMREIASRGLIDLKTLDKKSLVKLRFLAEIGKDQDQGTFVRLSLNRTELRVAARQDLRLLRILGIEALKEGAIAEFQRFLAELDSFYSTQGDSNLGEKRTIALWQVRSLLSKNEHGLAIQKLNEMNSNRKLDAIERHLRGVAYAQALATPKDQELAAEDFRLAGSMRFQPESHVAMGFALLRSGRTADAADAIKDLEAKTPDQLKFWVEMLKAEWSLATGRLEQAENICRLWAKKKPDFQTPVMLQIEILTRMGNTMGAQSLQEDLEERRVLSRWDKGDEALSSPLGPLSLAHTEI